ncbi:MAG: hypothetical protein QXT68_04315 [Halobacteria archaeon]
MILVTGGSGFMGRALLPLLARRERGLEPVSLRIRMVLGSGFYHEKSVLALLRLAFGRWA